MRAEGTLQEFISGKILLLSRFNQLSSEFEVSDRKSAAGKLVSCMSFLLALLKRKLLLA